MKFCFNPSFAKLYFKNLFPYSTLFFPQGTHHKYRGSFCYNLNHIAFVKHIKHINPRKTQKIKKPKSKIIQHIKYIFQKGTSNISAHALITSCCCFFFFQRHLQPLVYIYICPEWSMQNYTSLSILFPRSNHRSIWSCTSITLSEF